MEAIMGAIQRQMAFSAAVTQAMVLVGSCDRGAMRNELRDFLKLADDIDRDEVIGLWLNLKATGDDGVCLGLAKTYGLNSYAVGQAAMVIDVHRLETVCHMASMLGLPVIELACEVARTPA